MTTTPAPAYDIAFLLDPRHIAEADALIADGLGCERCFADIAIQPIVAAELIAGHVAGIERAPEPDDQVGVYVLADGSTFDPDSIAYCPACSIKSRTGPRPENTLVLRIERENGD